MEGVRDDDCGGARNGSPEGLSLPTGGSSSDLGIFDKEEVGAVSSFTGSEVDCAIPSFERVSTACALALAGERGLSGASLSSAKGISGERLHSDSVSTSGGQVVRAEKSSGTDDAGRWEELALGVGIGTRGEGQTLEAGGEARKEQAEGGLGGREQEGERMKREEEEEEERKLERVRHCPNRNGGRSGGDQLTSNSFLPSIFTFNLHLHLSRSV